jgi:hypothetical protein
MRTSRAVLVGILAASLVTCSGDRASRFSEVRGDVRLDGEPVVSGATAKAGDEIAVGRGRAIVEIEGLGTVRVFSDTRIRVHPRHRMSRVELVTGKIWALIDHRDGAQGFEVETVNAVAGVRGTELIVSSEGDVTEVRVRRGKAVVANRAAPDSEQGLHEGQRSTVRGRERPSSAEPYDVADDERLWDRLRAAFEEAKERVKEGAKVIKEGVKEAAPDVKRGLQKGGRTLRDGFRDIFKKK